MIIFVNILHKFSPVILVWSHLCEPLVVFPWLGAVYTMTIIYPTMDAVASDRGVAMRYILYMVELIMLVLKYAEFLLKNMIKLGKRRKNEARRLYFVG